MTKDEVATLLQQVLDGSEAGATAHPPALVSQARELHAMLSDVFAAAEDDDGAGDDADWDAEIAAYVDGRLGAEALEAFEARLAASPALRDEVEDLRDRIDAIGADWMPEAAAPETALEGLRASLTARRPLSADQQRSLFTDSALRAEYNRLVRAGTMPAAIRGPERVSTTPPLSMPARIAASSDKIVNDRSFPGGTSHIGSAGRPNLVQIRIEVSAASFPYTTLELRGTDGAIAYLALPPSSGSVITRIVDLNDPSDAEAIRLLRDPLSEGAFVTMPDP